jgi:hypothetical protein
MPEGCKCSCARARQSPPPAWQAPPRPEINRPPSPLPPPPGSSGPRCQTQTSAPTSTCAAAASVTAPRPPACCAATAARPRSTPRASAWRARSCPTGSGSASGARRWGPKRLYRPISVYRLVCRLCSAYTHLEVWSSIEVLQPSPPPVPSGTGSRAPSGQRCCVGCAQVGPQATILVYYRLARRLAEVETVDCTVGVDKDGTRSRLGGGAGGGRTVRACSAVANLGGTRPHPRDPLAKRHGGAARTRECTLSNAHPAAAAAPHCAQGRPLPRPAPPSPTTPHTHTHAQPDVEPRPPASSSQPPVV